MSILFTFPGQGAQRAGMLHALPQNALVRDAMDEASDVLGRDVLALDSAEALRSSVAVQLALLIAGVATARHLIARGRPARCRRRPVGGRLSGGGGRVGAVLCRCAAAGRAARPADAGGLSRRLRHDRDPGPGARRAGAADRPNSFRRLAGVPGQHQCPDATGDCRRARRHGARGRAGPGAGRLRRQAGGDQRSVALPAARRAGRRTGAGHGRCAGGRAAPALLQRQPGPRLDVRPPASPTTWRATWPCR